MPTSWYQLAAVCGTIVSCAYALGQQVQKMRDEMRLTRIDLAMLFQHLGLVQPSQVLRERQQAPSSYSILGRQKAGR